MKIPIVVVVVVLVLLALVSPAVEAQTNKKQKKKKKNKKKKKRPVPPPPTTTTTLSPTRSPIVSENQQRKNKRRSKDLASSEISTLRSKNHLLDNFEPKFQNLCGTTKSFRLGENCIVSFLPDDLVPTGANDVYESKACTNGIVFVMLDEDDGMPLSAVLLRDSDIDRFIELVPLPNIADVGCMYTTIERSDIDDEQMKSLALGNAVGPNHNIFSRSHSRQLDGGTIVNDEASRRSLEGCSSYRTIRLAVKYDSAFCADFGGVESAALSHIDMLIAIMNVFFSLPPMCLNIQLCSYEGFCGSKEDSFLDAIVDSDSVCDEGNSNLLTTFSNLYQSRPVGGCDVTHLFYGGDPFPSSSTIGCASLGELCSPMAYGVNHISFSGLVTQQAILVSHELGQNLNATPVNDSDNNQFMMESTRIHNFLDSVMAADNTCMNSSSSTLSQPAPSMSVDELSLPMTTLGSTIPQIELVANPISNGQLCQGDCDRHDDCAGSLKCYRRNKGDFKDVPGCLGGESDGSRTDYCVEQFAEITTSSGSYCEGDGIEICWDYSTGRGNDWIGIYSEGETSPLSEDYVLWANVYSKTQSYERGIRLYGCITFNSSDFATTDGWPLGVGSYDAWLIRDDGGWTGLTSTSFRVDPCLPLTIIGNPITNGQICEGDCDSNKDCANGLKCYHRKKGDFKDVPGCIGGESDGSRTDYCVQSFAEISTDKDTYCEGETIEICWDYSRGTKYDWIAVYDAGEQSSRPLGRDSKLWAYVKTRSQSRSSGIRFYGCIDFGSSAVSGTDSWPLNAGTYKAWLIRDNYNGIADSASFVVQDCSSSSASSSSDDRRERRLEDRAVTKW